MGYRLEGPGLIPGRGKFFVFSAASRPVLGASQSHTEWVPGDISLGVKRQKHEADHSPPCSEKVRNSKLYLQKPSIYLS
jgi:hypothetical protein